jgi:hypothetical protein
MVPITAGKNIRQECTVVPTTVTWECEISGLSCRVDEIFAQRVLRSNRLLTTAYPIAKCQGVGDILTVRPSHRTA